MNILFLGDIIGNPGRLCVSKELVNIIVKHNINVVIANGENAAGGIGINPSICDTLLKLGIDVLSLIHI